jgi:NADPH:quinone reductase-like Zn-dependent oxidoreductase
VAGVVKLVGAEVSNVRSGDRVIAFTGWGGFAEEVLADAARLIPMPLGADFKLASSFVMTYGTSYHALKDRAHLQAGETLVVLGAAGGVGLAAVELGKVLGAKVIACASSDDKLAVCKQHGADELINYSRDNLKQRLKGIDRGKGVDVAYDPVGGDYAEPVIRSMGWNSRYLVVGFAAGDIPRFRSTCRCSRAPRWSGYSGVPSPATRRRRSTEFNGISRSADARQAETADLRHLSIGACRRRSERYHAAQSHRQGGAGYRVGQVPAA